MSGFKVTPTKKPVNPDALAAFSAGADVHLPLAAPQAVPATAPEKQTESILFRLTKSQLDEFNFVYENTNVKSKQKLLEVVILPEIRRRAEALRQQMDI